MKLEVLIPSLLALYGAILSTILAIHELRKNRPMLKVTASFGYFYDVSGKPSESVILIKAVNVGFGKMPLVACGFLKVDNSTYQLLKPYPPSILPLDLEERKACTVGFSCKSFREKLDNKKIKAVYFQDQSGKMWIGRIGRKNRKLWLSSKDDGWKLS